LPVRAAAMEPLRRATDRLEAGYPRTPDVRDKTVVVLNAPINVMLSYLQSARALRHVPRPAHLYWLASSSSETHVVRSGTRSLEVSSARGFLLRPEETHYLADVHNLPVGAEVKLQGMHARVRSSTPDGRPQRVEFTFEQPLEAAQYLFRAYRDGELVPWPVPEIGGSSDFPPHEFFRIVANEALR
jgi:hypothetical protein